MKNKTEKPGISVVVVPRERHSLTRQCIEHILAFTPESCELIVVDAASPKIVTDRLKKWSETLPNFKWVRSEKMLFPYEAKNLALEHISETSKWVAFVDSDVKVSTGWLTWLLNAAEETGAKAAHPLYLFEHKNKVSIHMANGRMSTVGEKLNPVMCLVGKNLPEAAGLERMESDFLEFHTFLIRRDLLLKMAPFDALTLAEDVHFSFRLREAGEKVVFEPRSVITYVAGPPFETYDLPYFKFRWDPAGLDRSAKQLAERWPLDPKHAEDRVAWGKMHRSRVEPHFNLKSKWNMVRAEFSDLKNRAARKLEPLFGGAR